MAYTLDTVVDIPGYIVRRHKLHDDAMTVNDILNHCDPSLLREISDYLVEQAREEKDNPENNHEQYLAILRQAEQDADDLREAATLTPRPETEDEASDREAAESLPPTPPVEEWSTPDLHAFREALLCERLRDYEYLRSDLARTNNETDRRWEHGKRILRAAVIWMQCAAIRAEAYALGAESLSTLPALANALSLIERCAIDVVRARRRHESESTNASQVAMTYRELTTDAIARRDAKRAATLARVHFDAALATLTREVGALADE